MSEESSTIVTMIIASFFLAALMSFFIIAMVFIHRQRQVQNRQKLDQVRIEHEKTLLNIENEIQQETLTHIGRELHDNIGQLLSLAKLYLGSIRPHKQEEGMETLNMVIQEVRGLSKELNLDWVEAISINDFIVKQLERISSTGFCTTNFTAEVELTDLPKDQKLVLIRGIQESLNNAIKHAFPDKIEIEIRQSSNGNQIIIQDNGEGFDSPVKFEGSGMTNLKKRMDTIGGNFSLSSTVGLGTQIILTLPK